jgi:hypothetical protein
MTDGHLHWRIRVKSDKTWPVRLLRAPLKWVCDPDLFDKVDASPYPYGMATHGHGGKFYDCAYLSLLGILHRWSGLTLEIHPDD